VNLDGSPDLSGVSANDVIYLGTSSGTRHLSRITAVDNGAKTVTIGDSISLGAGVSWAIGGKRQTLDYDTSNVDTADAKEGWRFSLEAGTYPIATSLGFTGTWVPGDFLVYGPVEIVGAGAGSTTISWTGDFAGIVLSAASHVLVSDVTLSNGTSTSSSARAIESTVSAVVRMLNCTLDVYGAAVYIGAYCSGIVAGCDITSGGGIGVSITHRSNFSILNNKIHGCSGDGISYLPTFSYGACAIIGNAVYENGGDGIEVGAGQTLFRCHIANNVCDSNTGNGILFSGTLVDSNHASVINNILTSNGAYGISFSSSAGGDWTAWCDYNAFRANTSGETNNLTKGPHSVTLTADPYTDAGADDYTLNTTIGGGAACRNAGFGYTG